MSLSSTSPSSARKYDRLRKRSCRHRVPATIARTNSISTLSRTKFSDNLLKLLSQGVVPQSSLALESSMSAYQVGNVDVLTVIGSFTTVPNYETDYYRELTNYQTSLGTLVAEAHRGSIEVQSTP